MLEDAAKPLAIRGCENADATCEDGHGKEVAEFVTAYAKENNLPLNGEVNVGVHQVFCTEYCGNDHSRMLAKSLFSSRNTLKSGSKLKWITAHTKTSSSWVQTENLT